MSISYMALFGVHAFRKFKKEMDLKFSIIDWLASSPFTTQAGTESGFFLSEGPKQE
jgi:hypothetical protein